MKKTFLLSVACLFTLFLTGCANYVPEDTEHENIVPYDEFEKFLENRTDNYFVTTTSKENDAITKTKYLVSGELIMDVETKIIQETVEYNDISTELPDAVCYAMFEPNNEIYLKEFREEAQFIVYIPYNNINYSDFNIISDVYELKSNIDYGVNDLSVSYNDSSKTFEFNYTVGDIMYFTTYENTQEIIELPEYDFVIPNRDKIESFYDDYSTAETSYMLSHCWGYRTLTMGNHSQFRYISDEYIQYTYAIVEYVDYDVELIDISGHNTDLQIFNDVMFMCNIFKIYDKESFMKKFEVVKYDEENNIYSFILGGRLTHYTFDFENKTLNTVVPSVVLITRYNLEFNYSKLNDPSNNFELPTTAYVNLIK